MCSKCYKQINIFLCGFAGPQLIKTLTLYNNSCSFRDSLYRDVTVAFLEILNMYHKFVRTVQEHLYGG